MLAKVGKRLIKRFGTKGNVVLRRTTGTYDEDSLENVNTTVDISLLAYVVKAPSDQSSNSTKWFSSIRVYIALDKDFDGVISPDDLFIFNNISHVIASSVPITINGKISYIDAIGNG